MQLHAKVSWPFVRAHLFLVSRYGWLVYGVGRIYKNIDAIILTTSAFLAFPVTNRSFEALFVSFKRADQVCIYVLNIIFIVRILENPSLKMIAR